MKKLLLILAILFSSAAFAQDTGIYVVQVQPGNGPGGVTGVGAGEGVGTGDKQPSFELELPQTSSANAGYLQGIPINTNLPGVNDCLIYDGTQWSPGGCGGGGGGSSAWSSLTSAVANLTLNNAGYNTNFGQTGPVTWTWINTTLATSSTSQYSPILNLAGAYWNGTNGVDYWSLQTQPGAGTNAPSVLSITHTGSSSTQNVVSVPALTLTNGYMSFSENVAPNLIAGQEFLYANSSQHVLMSSYGGGPFYVVPQVETLTAGECVEAVNGWLMTTTGAPCGSGGGGSGTVGNCTNIDSIAYYALAGTAVTCAALPTLTQFLFAADSGAANAYVVNPSPAAVVATGVQVTFSAANSNTGASTINVNSFGVKNLTKFGGTALASGNILAGGLYNAEYDGTEWQVLNPSGPCPTCVLLNAPNNFTAAGTINLSALTSTSGLVMPNIAGGIAGRNGALTYNSTNANVHVGANSVDNLVGIIPSSVTINNADCTQWSVSSGIVLLADAGEGACVLLDTANVAGPSFTLNMALATSANAFVLPVESSPTPSTQGAMAFDSVNLQPVFYDGTVVCPVEKQQVNIQAGSGYTVLNGDCGKLVSISNASAQTLTLPSTVPPLGWWIDTQNTGAGTWSVSPNGHNLDNAAGSVALTTNQGMRIVSNGTNYFTERGVGGAGGTGTITPSSQFSLAIYTNSGSASVIGGVAAPVAPSGVPQFAIEVPSGGLPTAETFAPAGIPGRTVTTGTDTVLATDRANLLNYTDNSGVNVGFPQAGSSGFASNYVNLIDYKATAPGSNLLTITPTTSTYNGAATVTLGLNDFCFTYSIDNTNYLGNCTHGMGTIPVEADTGTTNAYVVAYPLIQSLQVGATVSFTVANHNTGASTLNINGLGAVALTKNGTLALISSDLLATGVIYTATYDGTEWQLLNPTGGSFTNFSAHTFWGNHTGGSLAPGDVTIGSSDTSPNWYSADSGTANTYVVAPSPALTALTVGSIVTFEAAHANTGASTINVSSLGVKALDKQGATALISGDILLDAIYLAEYDGTEWQVINPSTSSGGGGSGTVANCTVANSSAYYASSGTTVSCAGQSTLSQYLYAADSGAANAYVINLAPALASLTTGVVAQFTTVNPNTGASTINVNGLGVQNITKKGTIVLATGDILAGVVYTIIYDGTEWQLINPTSSVQTVINVKNYGCLGNGSTDDSSCVGNAITAAAGGGTIFFPVSTGAYVIKTPQTISSNNVTVRCDAGVELQQNTAANLFLLSGTNDRITNCILDGASTGLIAVAVTGASAINDVVEDNVVQNWALTGADGWIESKESDGLRINRNKLITGMTVSNGIYLNSVTGAITRAWITENEVVGAVGTTTAVAGISVVSNSGGAVSDIFIRNNDVTWAGTNSNGGFYSFASNTMNKLFWTNNSCKLSAASTGCYHIYGNQFGVFSNNFADDGGFVSSAPIIDLGVMTGTPVIGNVAKNEATTSAGCIRLIDVPAPGTTLGEESITGNTCENPGTGGSAVGIDVSYLSNDTPGSIAIGNNAVHLTRNGTIGIRINLSTGVGLNAGDSTITGNTVSSTAGTTQIGILLTVSGTAAGTNTVDRVAVNSNVMKGVATGFSLTALATNSAGAAVVSHLDGAQLIGDVCDTVTTCVSASAVNSGTSTGNVTSVNNLQVSNLQINSATTGILTSTTAASGAATVSGTQVGLLSTNSVTTAISFGGTNERGFTHTVTGSIALNGTTPVTVTLSGPDIFTSSTSYACTTADLTAASAFSTLVAYTSGTAFTLTGIAANTDTIQYVCVGY